MGYVPEANLLPLYVNANPGNVASSAALTQAVQALAETVNENYDFVKNLVDTELVTRLGVVNVKTYGAKGDGITDDTNAIRTAINAVSSGGVVVFPAGNYLATNFPSPDIVKLAGLAAKFIINGVQVPIPDLSGQTTGSYQVFVSPSGSDTNNCGLSSLYPFKTIQKAISYIPNIIKHRVIVKLADGIYDEGSKSTDPYGSSSPRECRCLINDKVVAARDLLIISGNVDSPENVIIDIVGLYSAFYVQNTTSVVIEGFKVRTTGVAASIFAHRGAYVRLNKFQIEGDDTAGAWGVLAESKVFVELDGDVSITGIERAIGALDGYVSFIGSSLNITSSAPASDALRIGNGSRVEIFSGVITVNVRRYVANVNGQSFCNISGSPGSKITATGSFIARVEEDSLFKANRINFDGGSRGIYGRNSELILATSCQFNNITGDCLDVQKCRISIENTTFNGSNEAIDGYDCDLSLASVTFNVAPGRRGIFARGFRIKDDGGCLFSGGFDHIRLEQNSVLDSRGSTYQNATGTAITVFRGAQAYYQSSTTIFTSNAANTAEEATSYSKVTSF